MEDHGRGDRDDLLTIIAAVRSSGGWTSKASIGQVGEVLGRPDWLTGPGDDGAVVRAGDDSLVVRRESDGGRAARRRQPLLDGKNHDGHRAGVRAVSPIAMV